MNILNVFVAIHEKIFITFMISSQVHMLIVLRLLKMAKFGQDKAQQRSFLFKNWLFYLSLFCTVGLCIFFVKHRVYCHDLGNSIKAIIHLALNINHSHFTAFSWFAFFEYWIAAANMGFHGTVIWDFPNEYITVGHQFCKQLNDNSTAENSVKKAK